MPNINFKQRDRNRYRKIYPYLIRKPIYELVSENDAQIELGIIDFTAGTDTGTFTFSAEFITQPIVTATPVSKDVGIWANINVFIETVTKKKVIIRISDPAFKGRVHIHAIAAS